MSRLCWWRYVELSQSGRPPQYPLPPVLGLNFCGFLGFFRLFCPPTLPLGEFWPETLCDYRVSLGLCTMKVWAMSRLCWWRYADRQKWAQLLLLACLLLACLLAACLLACCQNIFLSLRPKKGCKNNLVNQLGDPNQDFIVGPSWLLISWLWELFPL